MDEHVTSEQIRVKPPVLYKECFVCIQGFTSKENLENHLQFHHTRICVVCGKKFTTYPELLRHMRYHATRPKFSFSTLGINHKSFHVCLACVHGYKKSKDLEVHLCWTKPLKKIYSDIIKETGKKKRALDSEEKLVVREKGKWTVSCCYCLKKFPQLSELCKHLKIHLSIEPGLTKVPHLRRFKTKLKKYYKEVQEEHKQQRFFSCIYCQKNYNRKTNVWRHIKKEHKSQVSYHRIEVPVMKSDTSENDGTHSSDLDGDISITSESKPVKKEIPAQDSNVNRNLKCDINSTEISHTYHLAKHHQNCRQEENLKNNTDFSATEKSYLISKGFANQGVEESFSSSKDNKVKLSKKDKLPVITMPLQQVECKICSKKFNSLRSLYGHTSMHNRTYPFSKSSSGGKSRMNFKRERIDNRPKNFSCQVCGKRFVTISGVCGHMRVHKSSHVQKAHKLTLGSVGSKSLYKCSYCPEEFGKVKELLNHVRTHQSEHDKINCFTCAVCPQSFSTKANLFKHLEKGHGFPVLPSNDEDDGHETETSSKLPSDALELKNQSLLKRDVRSDETKSRSTKGYTEKESQDSVKLNIMPKKEMKHNSDSSQISASDNEKNCSISDNENDKLAFLECPICHKSFTSKKFYNKHMKYHSENKSLFPCRYCSKVFRYKCSRRVHEQYHVGDLKHKCSFCDTRFPNKARLQIHERGHTGELPYECPLCNRHFSSKSSTVQHLGTHKKPFKCQFCESDFSGLINLKSHMNNHHKQAKNHGNDNHISGKEHIFSCILCEEHFLTGEALHKHLIRHVKKPTKPAHSTKQACPPKPAVYEKIVSSPEGDKFSCSVCSKTFSRRSSLKGHMSVHLEEDDHYACQFCPEGSHHQDKHTHHHNTEEVKVEVKETILSVEDIKQEPMESLRESQETKTSHYVEKLNKSQNNLSSNVSLFNGQANETVPKLDIMNYSDEEEVICISDMEEGEGEIYSCSVCDKEFESAREVDMHMKTHDESNLQADDERDTEPFNEIDLKNDEERNIKTDDASEIKVHDEQNTQTGHERNRSIISKSKKIKNQCQTCSKSFSSVFHLKRHMNIHRTDRPLYKCRYCPKKLTESYSRKIHEMSHFKEISRPISRPKSRRCRKNNPIFKRKFNPPSKASVPCINDDALMHSIKTTDGKEQDISSSYINDTKTVKQGIPSSKEDNSDKTNEKNDTKRSVIDLKVIPIKPQSEMDTGETGSLRSVESSSNSNGSKQEDQVEKDLSDVVQSLIEVNTKTVEIANEQNKEILVDDIQSGSVGKNSSTKSNDSVCTICNKQLSSKYSLANHMVIHAIDRPRFKCRFCPKQFGHDCSRKKHEYSHSTQAAKNADKVVQSEKQLESAAEQSENESTPFLYSCPKCPKEFASREEIKEHLLVHSLNNEEDNESRMYKCGNCKKSFPNKERQRSHSCKQTISTLQKYTEYVSRENGRFKCTVCPSAFQSNFQLVLHKQKHKEETMPALENYKRQHFEKRRIKKGKNLKPYVCQVCKRRFTRSHLLQTHMVIHTTERPFSCKICSKGFKRKQDLAMHAQYHGISVPLQSPDGNVSFATESSKEHCQQSNDVGLENRSANQAISQNAHSLPYINIEPINEDGIGSNFSENGHVQMMNNDFVPVDMTQKMVPKNNEDFKCTDCGKDFNSLTELTQHLKRCHNTKPKSLTCHICHKRYHHNWRLQRHLKIHGGGRFCEICGASFKTKLSLTFHMKSHIVEENNAKQNRNHNKLAETSFGEDLGLGLMIDRTTVIANAYSIHNRDTESSDILIDAPTVQSLQTQTPAQEEIPPHLPSNPPAQSLAEEPADLASSDEDELFLCHSCDSVYTSSIALETHIQKHHM